MIVSNKFKISDSGLAIIKRFEGLRLHSYLCPSDVPTIGYGSTRYKGNPIVLGMVWTKEQAEGALLDDVKFFESAVNKSVKVDLEQKMFDALVSLVYNIGAKAFKDSTLLELLNSGNYSGAADQFLRWNKSNGKVVRGLTLRREDERELFLEGLAEMNGE